MLQAVFYMFVFRHKQLLDLEDGKVMPAMHCFYEYSTVLQNVVIFWVVISVIPRLYLNIFMMFFLKTEPNLIPKEISIIKPCTYHSCTTTLPTWISPAAVLLRETLVE